MVEQKEATLANGGKGKRDFRLRLKFGIGGN